MKDLNYREIEILKLVAQGKTYSQIVKSIGLKLPTIKFYVRSAKDKLGATNGAHAVAIFIKTYV